MAEKKPRSSKAISRSTKVPVRTSNMWEPLSRIRDEFDRMFDETPNNTFGSRLMQKFYETADPVVELRDKKDE